MGICGRRTKSDKWNAETSFQSKSRKAEKGWRAWRKLYPSNFQAQKKTKKDKKKRNAIPSETRLSKENEAANRKLLIERTRKQRKARPSTLLIEATESKTLAEVRNEIRYVIKLEDRSVFHTKNEASRFKSKTYVLSGNPKSAWENVEEAIKRECPGVTNTKISITSVKTGGQKLTIVEVARLQLAKDPTEEQHAADAVR